MVGKRVIKAASTEEYGGEVSAEQISHLFICQAQIQVDTAMAAALIVPNSINEDDDDEVTCTCLLKMY